MRIEVCQIPNIYGFQFIDLYFIVLFLPLRLEVSIPLKLKGTPIGQQTTIDKQQQADMATYHLNSVLSFDHAKI